MKSNWYVERTTDRTQRFKLVGCCDERGDTSKKTDDDVRTNSRSCQLQKSSTASFTGYDDTVSSAHSSFNTTAEVLVQVQVTRTDHGLKDDTEQESRAERRKHRRR